MIALNFKLTDMRIYFFQKLIRYFLENRFIFLVNLYCNIIFYFKKSKLLGVVDHIKSIALLRNSTSKVKISLI